MTLLAVLALFAAVSFAGWRWGGLGRRGALPLAAAATLALAGYLWTGRLGLAAGGPTPSAARGEDTVELLALRDRLSRGGFGTARSWIVFSDGQARRGHTATAVAILTRGLRDEPRSVDLHTALAFALIAHADGAITPAADLALQRVRALDPAAPAPDFVAGEEAARADRLGEARAVWLPLLARSAADAPWRRDLAIRLALLDRIERSRGGG